MMKIDEVYDLPDLQFAKWCEKTFTINRGVYNTIDQKLFDLGYKHIQIRRKAIIVFLKQHVEETDRKFYKFGHGKLSVALHNFQI
ncbi:hypothetical protein [Lysinibacillus sp. BW-2-10]|uniref:hypothetical protein n=1 Tax=Lysinibacillus sp. BW-2-10 TaxID=2590030 RepID=UPI00117CC05F|nr:hypothetical protein [Lysinibacillus sp. BW-2-10]TSI02297.1 hypothetical protein FJQ64_19175 [Lysinibacillus sp. BW-2-10]